MANEFIRIDEVRIRLSSIDKYWPFYHTDKNTALLVLITVDGDRVGFEMLKEDVVAIVDYLDHCFKMATMKASGGWQHMGQLHQEIKSKRI